MRRIRRLLSIAMAGALVLCATPNEAFAGSDVLDINWLPVTTSGDTSASKGKESKKKKISP